MTVLGVNLAGSEWANAISLLHSLALFSPRICLVAG